MLLVNRKVEQKQKKLRDMLNTVVLMKLSEKMKRVQDTATAINQTATFSVATLATQGETATFTYTIENYNTVAAQISINAFHDGGATNPKGTLNYFDISVVCNDVEMATGVTTSTGEGENKTYNTTYTANSELDEVDKAALLIPAASGTSEDAVPGTITVVVTVNLNRTPSTNVTPETFFMHLTATSVDANTPAVQPQ